MALRDSPSSFSQSDSDEPISTHGRPLIIPKSRIRAMRGSR